MRSSSSVLVLGEQSIPYDESQSVLFAIECMMFPCYYYALKVSLDKGGTDSKTIVCKFVGHVFV